MASPVVMTRSAESGEIGPTPVRDRILALDVLRGVAILGILLVNIELFSMVSAAWMDPTGLATQRAWMWRSGRWFTSSRKESSFRFFRSFLGGHFHDGATPRRTNRAPRASVLPPHGGIAADWRGARVPLLERRHPGLVCHLWCMRLPSAQAAAANASAYGGRFVARGPRRWKSLPPTISLPHFFLWFVVDATTLAVDRDRRLLGQLDNRDGCPRTDGSTDGNLLLLSAPPSGASRD